MSKKARRRPTWKKDNTYWPKSFKWFFDGHTVTIYPKSVGKELAEILHRNFLKEIQNEQDSIS